MNKKSICFSFLTVTAIVLIAFFSFKIFEKIYFNETFYSVPDLKTLTLAEAEKMLENNELNIRNMGEEFSELPVGEIFLQEPESGNIVKKNRNIKVWISKGEALVEVPELKGMNFLDAKAIAEQKGLIIDRVATTKANIAYNEVISTDPATGTLLRRGQKISFLINGSEQLMDVRVPDIIGVEINQAKEILTASSLLIGKITYVSLPEIEKDLVIETSVLAGRRGSAGTVIDITVHKENE